MTRKPPTAFPLFERFPALSKFPRAELCTLPSPVEKLTGNGGELWIKRDDLNAPLCGGNKVRSLEFMLGGLAEGDQVITVGGAGSTHVLSTAIHAARHGISTTAVRWRHNMNDVANEVSARIGDVIPGSAIHRTALTAVIQARVQSAAGRVRYIPLGAAVPLGILGHVNAALELARQIDEGELPVPETVVLPLGSGGTVAGLLLGFAIAGLPVRVVGARVGPRPLVNRLRVLSLARRTAQLIEKATWSRIDPVDSLRLSVVHHVYGGAYGRPLTPGVAKATKLHASPGVRLDDTYSAKAWVAAMDEAAAAKGPVLFWLTFDARCLTN